MSLEWKLKMQLLKKLQQKDDENNTPEYKQVTNQEGMKNVNGLWWHSFYVEG